MRKILLIATFAVLAPTLAHAHAFLDRASPAVGRTVATAPTSVTIWFTQALEPAFSSIEVQDQSGARVDAGDAKVDAKDPTVLRVALKPLRPGKYRVFWRVVSVDTHPSEGTFAFTVGS